MKRRNLFVLSFLAIAVAVAAATAIAYKKLALGPQFRGVEGGMVKLSGGSYMRGCADCNLEDAVPVHRVTLNGFWIDETPVTNQQFSEFTAQTDYKTIAERPPRPEDFPDVPADKVVPGSAVFTPPKTQVSLENPLAWWTYQAGANWRNPEGPDSSIAERMDHPAVHIAYDDAVAYCTWARKRLPTEAEYEFAARGGLEGKKYSWGDELQPEGKWLANIWQGDFPNGNTGADGYSGTSPVRAFPPNDYGIYDMSGNVWQWTADWYRPDTYKTLVDAGTEIKNPQGPTESLDPNEPGVLKRVQRGGSFLCTEKYCTRYLAAARGKGEPGSSGSNIGFRCVKDL